uniref:Uncharacterized protein n=1 Tax=Meloidogyne incognita TaxID=6306 RepID=A0A914MTV7_MELIC
MEEAKVAEIKDRVRHLSYRRREMKFLDNEEEQLKENLYISFMRFHERRHSFGTRRIHENFLKEKDAFVSSLITNVIKDLLFSELKNPVSKYWDEIDYKFAIYACNEYDSFYNMSPRDTPSSYIIMNDITTRMESKMNIDDEAGSSTSATLTMSEENLGMNENSEEMLPSEDIRG